MKLTYQGIQDKAAFAAADTGVDALIIQDMALRRMNLPVELHASTQVGTTTPEGALFLEKCGFSRVILERALTLEDNGGVGVLRTRSYLCRL